MTNHFQHIGLLLTCCFFVFPLGAARADIPLARNPKIVLKPVEAHNFETAFRSLARQGKLAFVIEGRPLVTDVSDREASILCKNTDLSSCLEALCQQYDYSIVLDKSNKLPFVNVLVLQKNYTQSNDIPGVTIGECLAAVQDAQRITARFAGSSALPDRHQIVQNALAGLSRQQAAQLGAGIPIATLAPAQKNRLFRIATYFYFGKNTTSLFSRQFILSHANEVIISKALSRGRPQIVTSLKDRFGTITRPINPRTAIFGRDDTPSQHKKTLFLLPAASTLGEAIRQIQPPPEVEPYLLAKPITLISNPSASDTQLVKALALVYGLKAVQSQTGSWRIERNRVKTPFQMDTIYAAIKETLPLPLLRATQPLPSPKRDGETPFSMAEMQQRMFDRDRPSDLKYESAHRIEFLYQAKAAGKAELRVTLAELGPEAQQAFAVMTMASYLNEIKDLRKGPPFYITNFSDTVAIGGVGGGMQEIGLAQKDSSGSVYPMIKMSVPVR